MLPANIDLLLNKLALRVTYTIKLRSGAPIIIYNMAKVGSASVRDSLVSAGVEPVFHLHIMNPDLIKIRRQRELANHQRPHSNYWIGERLYMDVVKKGNRAKFITLVREPIGRSISHLFNNFSRLTNTEYANADFSIEELTGVFLKSTGIHIRSLTWFDTDMKPVLGIDVYEHPFPKEKGYLSIKQDNFELLILKLELDDSVKERAIKDFLGIPIFRLTKTNIAQDKVYARTYADFKANAHLPESYVEIMCKSRYMRHFYNDAEIESIRCKWQDRVGKAELPPDVYEELVRAASIVVD